jgi:hypothetical protein
MLWLLIPLVMLLALALIARLFPMPRSTISRQSHAGSDRLDPPEGPCR